MRMGHGLLTIPPLAGAPRQRGNNFEHEHVFLWFAPPRFLPIFGQHDRIPLHLMQQAAAHRGRRRGPAGEVPRVPDHSNGPRGRWTRRGGRWNRWPIRHGRPDEQRPATPAGRTDFWANLAPNIASQPFAYTQSRALVGLFVRAWNVGIRLIWTRQCGAQQLPAAEYMGTAQCRTSSAGFGQRRADP